MTFRSRGPAGLPRSRVTAPVLVWRLRPLWLAAGLIAALVIVVAGVTGIATDYLWFRAIGFGGVFRVTYGVRWAMFGITGAFMALAAGLSATLARRMRPAHAPLGQPPGLERWRLAANRHWHRTLTAVMAVIGVVSGLAGARSWATWVQFANRTSFGRQTRSSTWTCRSSCSSTRSCGWC